MSNHRIGRNSRLLAGLTVLLAMLAGSQPLMAQEVPSEMLAALHQARIPLSGVGLFVQQVDAAQPMLSLSATRAFSPASVMKLVTTDAALELLGPIYRWKTRAYVDGSLSNGVLNGDLSIKGSGDPKLVMENFWLFLRLIRARGVRDIRGDLILDRSAFEEQSYDPAEFDDDPQKPYNVGPDALLLNYKTIALRFIPDAATRQVNVSMEPALAGYVLKPPKFSGGTLCGDWKSSLQADVGVAVTVFHGSYAAACGEQVWYLNPYRMSSTEYFAAVFRQMWAELGGTIKGQVRTATVAPTASLLAEWQSPALPEVIHDINKYSNNVMARQLLLSIGAQADGGVGTSERGARAISDWLAAKGIASDTLLMDNGSGLSRHARIAPATLGRLLVAAYHSALMPELIASLPLVAYDGTMRHRLRGEAVAGQAHIKTGSLGEVRSVAGYVQAASGKMYVVVCLINHPNAPAGQPAQDALLQWVFEHG